MVKRGDDRKDKELHAIATVFGVLKALDDAERERVLEYVMSRLEVSTVRPVLPASGRGEHPAPATAEGDVQDIRTLVRDKQPRSANEMAVLAAYYLSELAPPGERRDTIDSDTLRRYFKMAAFRLPRVPRNTLFNASAAGYMDSVGRGEFRLNPVGYNLVVHGLPRGSAGVRTASARKRTAGKTAKRKKRR